MISTVAIRRAARVSFRKGGARARAVVDEFAQLGGRASDGRDMKQDVHDAALAVILEYAKRKPSIADQERFYGLVQQLIEAATKLGALEHAQEEQRALLKASGGTW